MNPFPDESRPVLEQDQSNNLFVLVTTVIFLALMFFAWLSPNLSLARLENGDEGLKPAVADKS